MGALVSPWFFLHSLLATVSCYMFPIFKLQSLSAQQLPCSFKNTHWAVVMVQRYIPFCQERKRHLAGGRDPHFLFLLLLPTSFSHTSKLIKPPHRPSRTLPDVSIQYKWHLFAQDISSLPTFDAISQFPNQNFHTLFCPFPSIFHTHPSPNTP